MSECFSAEEKAKVEEAKTKLREVLDKADSTTDEIKSATKAAQEAGYIIGQKMYESQQANATTEAPNTGKANDVEYEVKDA